MLLPDSVLGIDLGALCTHKDDVAKLFVNAAVGCGYVRSEGCHMGPRGRVPAGVLDGHPLILAPFCTEKGL